MSLMQQESREAPDAVQRFFDSNTPSLQILSAKIRAAPLPCLITSARGSSDHAAAYLKYLVEIMTGTPVASVGASVVSIYGATLNARGAVCFTISQSGQSPDIVQVQAAAKAGGAFTVALVNAEDSPAARDADLCLPLCAGAETSVAATKSVICALAAAAALVAHWTKDESLINALHHLPEALRQATHIAWPALINAMQKTDSLYVLGRGPAFPIAQEIALKLKETCAIHAEAYSTAEVMHGPLELVGQGFTVLALVPDDAAADKSRATLLRMRQAGATVLEIGSAELPYVRTGHWLLDPLTIILSAYLMIEKLAGALGRNPDTPRHLHKITKTV